MKSKALTKRDGEQFREFMRSIATMAVNSQNITFYTGHNDNEKLHEWLDDIESDLSRAREILRQSAAKERG